MIIEFSDLVLAYRGEHLVVELGASEHGQHGGPHHVLCVGHCVGPKAREECLAVLDSREAIVGLCKYFL